MAEERHDFVILLGAGASKDAGLPLMRDLLDDTYISRIEERFQSTGAAAFCRQLKKIGRPFEQLLMESWRAQDLPAYYDLLRYYEWVLFAAETNAGLEVAADGLFLAGYYPGDWMYFLKRLTRYPIDVTVISFNHDIWVEHGAEWAGFTYGTLQHEVSTIDGDRFLLDSGTPRFTLLKLHGSFNFVRCEACRRRVAARDLMWRDCRPCPHCGGRLRPDYIAPLVAKDIAEPECVWADAAMVLEKASVLLVMGYSLPAYDLCSRSLLESHLKPDCDLVLVDPFAAEVAGNYTFLRRRRTYITAGAREFLHTWEPEELLLALDGLFPEAKQRGAYRF